jgi:hypothetical protein
VVEECLVWDVFGTDAGDDFGSDLDEVALCVEIVEGGFFGDVQARED